MYHNWQLFSWGSHRTIIMVHQGSLTKSPTFWCTVWKHKESIFSELWGVRAAKSCLGSLVGGGLVWWWEGRWQKKSNTNALFPRLLARRHHGSVEAPRDWLGTGGLQFHITHVFSCCAPIHFLLRGYPLDIFYAHPPTIIIAESNLFMSLWYIMDVYLICFYHVHVCLI